MVARPRGSRDGTPHQWTTPAGENTPYPKGVSVYNVPDMPDPGPGALTFFYTNQQSARLMFYHDHAYGLTRLNVYAGEAAPYLLNDPVEQKLVNGGVVGTVTVAPSTIPTEQIPLVIQDKSFVPTDTQLIAQDPTWDKAHWGGLGSLWFPHVYMPNQNPNDLERDERHGPLGLRSLVLADLRAGHRPDARRQPRARRTRRWCPRASWTPRWSTARPIRT